MSGLEAVHVHGQHLVERRAIQRAARFPRLLAVAPEIAIAEVLHPDQPLGFIVKIDLRHAHAELAEKARDVDVVPVLIALVPVLRENERIRADADAVEVAIRPAFLQRIDVDLLRREARETDDGLIDEVGDHVGQKRSERER